MATISAIEFAHWIEFYRLEPFGEEWRQAAQAAWAPIAATGSKKESGGHWEVNDFMPCLPPEMPDAAPVDSEQMKMKLFRVFGPKLRRVAKETTSGSSQTPDSTP